MGYNPRFRTQSPLIWRGEEELLLLGRVGVWVPQRASDGRGKAAHYCSSLRYLAMIACLLSKFFILFGCSFPGPLARKRVSVTVVYLCS